MAFSSITVKGLTPDLLVLGAYQRFHFSDDRIVKFQQFNAYAPVLGLPTENNIELRNSRESGFRFHQLTTFSESFLPGTLKLQHFTADGPGTDIFTYTNGTLTFNASVDFTGLYISPDYTPPTQDYQSFIFPTEISEFNLISTHVPAFGSPSTLSFNMLNSSGYGYSWAQITYNGGTQHGDYNLYYKSPSTTTAILTFTETEVFLNLPLVMFNKSIANVSSLSIGTSSANGQLQFSNAFQNRKIVLHELSNNDYEFCGFGTTASYLTYNVEATTASHVFYAATSSSARTELVRFMGTGEIVMPSAGTFFGKSPSASAYSTTLVAYNLIAADTWIKNNNTLTLDTTSRLFTLASNVLTYTGGTNITAVVTIIGSFYQSPISVMSFALYKNGVRVPQSQIDTKATGTTSNSTCAFSLSCTVSLSAGDYLELWMLSNGTIVSVTVPRVNFIVTSN